MELVDGSNHQGIVESLRAYNLKKNIKAQLKIINPLLGKKETDIKVHLMNALINGIITKSESDFLEIKMELGRMCLELEQVLDSIYVTMLFYDKERNNVFHGAGPSIPVEFFDFFSIVNEQGILDENCASCGKAIYTQEVVQTDIETSPLWTNLKESVIEYGFKSCTSIPFFTHTGRLAGTFAHYSNKPNNFLTQDEVEMIQEKISMFSFEIQTIADRIHEYSQVGNARLTI
ncbi:GAF domain-containing protein [Sporosarcina sp. E16_3]|uniref:GAF domain-containing protein n=1 Tax=Sporosarcina sp. E16_3 TaxID=2789293 RepID=UPI001A90E219|nr:GAF domain-containing protein [Sporosarcina sp. E16_3]MBO0603590.1 GAF domain-containing protein [Sporosarcina sp. E16_3]